MRQRRRNAIRPLIDSLENRVLLSAVQQVVATPSFQLLHHAGEIADGTSTPQGGLSPSQMQQAYGINNIRFGSISGTGAGQTIAIIDAYNDPTLASDLASFDSYYGLPAPPSFAQLDQNGGTNLPADAPVGGWGIEESLDVEWAHAIAPSANIILYEASSSYDTDLINGALVTAKNNASVTAISMSFGGGEYSGETDSDSIYTSSHITFLASTGDNGSPAAYPSYSPNVIAIGGTTLSVSSTGAYQGETGWSGSGGGVSSQEPEPAYQDSVQTTGARMAPDVSMDADPNTGVAFYDSYDNGSSTPWGTVGGTSLAAPMWSGLISIANQGRVANGLPVFNTVSNPSATNSTEALPLLYQAPKTDFHDILSGSNGGYSAGPGYDAVTGIGSPVANLLIPFLAGSGVVQTPVTVGLTGGGPNPSNATQPLTFTATVSGGVPNGETVTLEDTSNNNAIIATGTLSNGSATLNVPAGTLLAGTHNLIAVYAGDAHFAPGQSSPYTQIVQVAVTSVVINGNNPVLAGVQRSMVDSIVYTFSEPVTLAQAGAFTIAIHPGRTGTVPTLNLAPVNPDAKGASTQWVVTFSGAGVVNNSIANGAYDITLNSTAVNSEANPLGPVQTRPTDTFYRLFGDVNGDGVVNALDNAKLKAALSVYSPIFDYNGDGVVNAFDNAIFKQSMSISFVGLNPTI